MTAKPIRWVSAAETGTLASLGVFAAGYFTGSAPLWAVSGVATVAAFALTFAVAAHTGDSRIGWIAGAAAIGAAGWVIWAHEVSVWHAQTIVALICGAFVFTPLLASAWASHEQKIADEAAAADLAAQAAALKWWSDLLEGVDLHKISTVRVVKTRSGHTITYRLPSDGSVTLAKLRDSAPRIEIAMTHAGTELQPDTIRFESGKHAGEVKMIIAERDVLADLIPYPMDLTPLTINKPFDIGWSEDGSLCFLHLREIRVLIVGETGAGKTNLLHVIIAQLSRCVDVIIFGADLKGGGLLAPWLRPWINRQSRRPVIDWPATDRAEAELQMQALVRVIQARMRRIAGRAPKIVPSPEWPTYVYVFDECQEGFTTNEPKQYRDKWQEGQPIPRSLAWLATRITNTGRSAAVDAIFGAQRGTTGHLPSDIKSQCAVRIGLGTTTVGEASNLAPDNPLMQRIMSLIGHAGAGVVQRKNARPHADKFYQLEDPDKIAQIAKWSGDHIRPEPNGFDSAALGDDYASRWQRLKPLLSEWSDMAAGGGSFEQIVAQMPDPDEGLREWHKIARDIIAKSGSVGVQPGIVRAKLKQAGHDLTRETVTRWIGDQGRAGQFESLSHGRWRIPRDEPKDRSA